MRYLYYKLCKDFNGKNYESDLYSMFWFSTLNSINIITFLVFLRYLLNIALPPFTRNEIIIYSSLFGLLIVGLNYFYLYKKRKIIFEKYMNESKLMRIIGFIILYVYMIGTFGLAYLFSQVFPIR